MDSDDDDEDVSEEQDLQNEVDEILNNVIGLDLGDAVSNK